MTLGLPSPALVMKVAQLSLGKGEAIDCPTVPPAADAHAVQPYYTRLLAEACGVKVSLTPDGENVVIAAA